jgi:hypothetical protein
VDVDKGESLKDWKFGFIQVVREDHDKEIFLGRTSKDRSMTVFPNLEVPAGFLLDCKSDIDDGRVVNPFLSQPTTGDALRPPLLTCTTGDHPVELFAPE